MPGLGAPYDLGGQKMTNIKQKTKQNNFRANLGRDTKQNFPPPRNPARDSVSLEVPRPGLTLDLKCPTAPDASAASCQHPSPTAPGQGFHLAAGRDPWQGSYARLPQEPASKKQQAPHRTRHGPSLAWFHPFTKAQQRGKAQVSRTFQLSIGPQGPLSKG